MPENGSGSFDLQKFVVRILSSDHTRKNDPNKGGGSGWMTPEDTQVYLTDNAQNAHAYVHHLTLHDVHARGYVRPYCLCYITNDANKIMNNFESLLNAFTQVSQVIKYGNNCRFVRDIQKQLAGISRIGIKQHLSTQNDTKRKQTKFTDEQSDDDEELENMNGDFLSEFPELSSDVFKQVLVDLSDLKKKFLNHMKDSGQKLDTNIMEQIHTNLLASSPQVFSPTNQRGQRGKPTIKSPIGRHTPFTSPLAISFSNPEFVSLYDGGLSVSAPSLQRYMPTVLKCIHKNTNFEEKLRDISQITGGIFETAQDMIYHILEHYHRPSIVLDIERYDLTHLNTSQDLSSNLFIGKSFVQDFNLEKDHNTMQTLQHWSPATNQSPRQASISADSNADKYSIYRNGFKGSGCYVSSVFDTSGTDVQAAINKWKRAKTRSPSPTQEIPSSNLLSSLISDLKSSPADLVPGRGILDLSRLSFIKDIVYSLLTGRLVIVHGQPESELSVRNLIVTFSLFVPGLLASYHQDDQGAITRPQICYWRTRAISLADLTKFKLIGLSKKAAIPKALEGLVTRYDYEEQTLTTNVQYKGTLLAQIFDREKRWVDETTYIAYIHSVFTDMGSKAALLYHQHYLYNIKNQNSRVKYITPARVIEKTPPTPTPKQDELPPPTPQHTPTVSGMYNLPRRTSNGSSNIPVVPLSPNSRTRKKTPSTLKRKAPSFLTIISSSLSPNSTMTGTSAHDLESMRDCMKSNLRYMGLRGHDATIIDYLADTVKQQQTRQLTHAPMQLQLENNVNASLVTLKHGR